MKEADDCQSCCEASRSSAARVAPREHFSDASRAKPIQGERETRSEHPPCREVSGARQCSACRCDSSRLQEPVLAQVRGRRHSRQPILRGNHVMLDSVLLQPVGYLSELQEVRREPRGSVDPSGSLV